MMYQYIKVKIFKFLTLSKYFVEHMNSSKIRQLLIYRVTTYPAISIKIFIRIKKELMILLI